MAGYTVDEAGFAAFYEATARGLFRQMYVMCGDTEEARDCLQEGYIRAWQRWDRISAYDDPAAWVRRVSWRVAVSRFRQARRRFQLFRQPSLEIDGIETIPELLALTTALKRLPRFQREAIILHHLVGLSVEEIGSELHVPVGTVKARLSRGRAELAEHLSDKDQL